MPVTIDLAGLPSRKAHDLLISVVIPRPIAWVSTVDGRGNADLAPFSMFNAVTWRPPTVCFSAVNRDDGSEKTTVANIRATGRFVVNLVPEDAVERMVKTSRVAPPGKAEAAGIELVASTYVDAPRIAMARVSFECELHRIVTVGEGACAGNLVLGAVLTMHVLDGLLDSAGNVDWRKLQAVGRLGGSEYCAVRDAFTVHDE